MTNELALKIIDDTLRQSGRLREDAETGEKVVDHRSLLDTLAAVLVDGRFNRSDKTYVSAAMEELFERYVRDFDIPGVSNLVEPFVDDLLKSMIAPAVNAMFDRFVPE